MTVASLDPGFAIRHDEEQAKSLWTMCAGNPHSPYGDDDEFEAFLDCSRRCAAELPGEVRDAVTAYAQRGNEFGALLVRGFPVVDRELGPTPDDWRGEAQAKTVTATETYLLAVTSLLGEVFAFQRQHDGSLIQNMVPIRADARTQRGTGSEVFLEWHTEDAYDSLRADYIGIHCVRSDPRAKTAISFVQDMPLSADDTRVLLQRRFRIGVDPASGGTALAQDGPLVSVLIGHQGRLGVRVDTDCVEAERGDDEAAAALERFKHAIPAAARYIVLEAGDLLVIDNKRTMHARTAYSPRYDGTDRWLQRVSITRDLDSSRSVRTTRRRVIDLDARLFV